MWRELKLDWEEEGKADSASRKYLCVWEELEKKFSMKLGHSESWGNWLLYNEMSEDVGEVKVKMKKLTFSFWNLDFRNLWN